MTTPNATAMPPEPMPDEATRGQVPEQWPERTLSLQFLVPWGLIYHASLVALLWLMWRPGALPEPGLLSRGWEIWLAAHFFLGVASHWVAFSYGRRSAGWFFAGFLFSVPGFLWAYFRPPVTVTLPPESMRWREAFHRRCLEPAGRSVHLGVVLVQPLLLVWLHPEAQAWTLMLLHSTAALCFLARLLEPKLGSRGHTLSGASIILPLFAAAFASGEDTWAGGWAFGLILLYSTADMLRFGFGPDSEASPETSHPIRVP